MATTEKPRDQVGVRELRQNLSVYLERVKAGETLQVTERGQPVAQLTPLPAKPPDWWDEMIASGKLRPATRDLLDITPLPPAPPGEKTLSEHLQDLREERLP